MTTTLTVYPRVRRNTDANKGTRSPALTEGELYWATDTKVLYMYYGGIFESTAGGGGFSNPMTTLGDIIYENVTPVPARLAGNTTATRQFLRQVGNGVISAAPAWDVLAAGDMPAFTGFTATDVALDDELPEYDTSATANKKIAVDRLLGLGLHAICEGRPTLTSGVPVTTTDVIGAGTIYFTPYKGNRIGLYDGTRWKLYTFTERSLALSVTSGKLYDVFMYDSAGTLTLELSAAWTNETTRADALTIQDGVVVKSGATTRRWLFTILASGTNTTEDSITKRYVVSHYNPILKPCKSTDSSDRSTSSTSPVQVGSVQFSFISLGEQAILTEGVTVASSAAGSPYPILSIGSGSTTTATNSTQNISCGVSGVFGNSIARCLETPAAGLVTRYLLFRSFVAANTVHADGTPYNNLSGSGGQPGTTLEALIPC